MLKGRVIVVQPCLPEASVSQCLSESMEAASSISMQGCIKLSTIKKSVRKNITSRWKEKYKIGKFFLFFYLNVDNFIHPWIDRSGFLHIYGGSFQRGCGSGFKKSCCRGFIAFLRSFLLVQCLLVRLLKKCRLCVLKNLKGK